MAHNREYGNDDSQVKKLLQKYRLKDGIHNQDSEFPQYSAVRSARYENTLATTEISWLDKIAEINDKVCDQTIYQGKDENNNLKLANSMKFSFNQNYQTQVKQEQKNHQSKNSKAESHESLRDIYMKQLQKESKKIKEVQRARKQIIESINNKKHVTSNRHNKQNLVGSIKRKNSNFQIGSKPAQYNRQNKSSLGFETIELPKNIIIDKKKQTNKQEETNSLRYLQQSLAKTKKITQKPLGTTEYVQISKKCYLESASIAQTFNGNQSNITIKQFNQRQVTFAQVLQILFQRVDKCKIGKLDKQNCDYQTIQDLFKIVFGSLFARIKFKNLTLNKQQFVKIGLQMVKELHSEELNTFIQMTISDRDERAKRTENLEKGKAFYCQKCENNILNVHTYSPEKNQQNYSHQKQVYKHKALPVQRQQALQSNKIQQKQRAQQKSFGFKDQQLHRNQYKGYKLQKNKHTEHNIQLKKTLQQQQIQRNQSKVNQYNNSFFGLKDEMNDLQALDMVPPKKKKRNISQSIIAQHKRNLEDLTFLNEQIQSCLSQSSRLAINNNQQDLYYMKAHYNSIL